FTFLDNHKQGLRFIVVTTMKSNLDNLDQLADRLGDLSPSRPNAQLAHRLEMALHQADKEIAQPSNIIYHPFVQWTLAAAALFVGLLVAFQSTRFEAPTGHEVAEAESEVLEIYKLIDGEMQSTGPSEGAMQEVSAQLPGQLRYVGVEIHGGVAYRKFQSGNQVRFERIHTNPSSQGSQPENNANPNE
ncbi:MAG: hypothetical protein ACI8UO_003901, partial [Verrucomicrobiales bacterium]